MIKNSIQAIESTDETKEKLFSNDIKNQYAAIHHLMVIGQIAIRLKKVNHDFIKSAHNVNWRNIRNMQFHNNFLDNNFRPDPEKIQIMVKENIPKLLSFLKNINVIPDPFSKVKEKPDLNISYDP